MLDNIKRSAEDIKAGIQICNVGLKAKLDGKEIKKAFKVKGKIPEIYEDVDIEVKYFIRGLEVAGKKIGRRVLIHIFSTNGSEFYPIERFI